MKKRLLIAGGSGLIGSALADASNASQWETLILSRHPGPGRIVWDPSQQKIDFTEIQKFDAIINLTGASLSDGRWTEKKKEEILTSRINSCQTLAAYLRDGRITSSFYLGSSGVGVYGDRGNQMVNEETPIDHQEDWLIKLVLDWEAAHHHISELGIRTVILRTGIVLSKQGGALKEILATPGFGLLSYFGDGHQIWPWIHILDMIGMILFCIEHQDSSGIYIASAPHPVSNKVLTKSINHYLSSKRIVAGVPKFILSLILGKMHKVLFDSCNASSMKIEGEGFQFRFPEINEACRDLLKK